MIVMADSVVPQPAFALDGNLVRGPRVLVHWNRLTRDQRTQFRRLLFDSDVVSNWRLAQRSSETECAIHCESDPVRDCGICEAYEYRSDDLSVGLIGNRDSSFAGEDLVHISRTQPAGAALSTNCACEPSSLATVFLRWGCRMRGYDATADRPPQDSETCLTEFTSRFVRTGRVERSGRRHVYADTATGFLYYVDNLHFGKAAHLEVFTSDGRHLGTATLDGELSPGTAIAGRCIHW